MNEYDKLKLGAFLCWITAVIFGILLGVGIYQRKKNPQDKKTINNTTVIVLSSIILILLSLGVVFMYRSISPSEYRLLRNL